MTQNPSSAFLKAPLAFVGLVALVACGPGAGEPPPSGGAVVAPGVHVQVSDDTIFKAKFVFGAPRFEEREEAGESWTQVRIPGLGGGGEDGSPELPVHRSLLAVPPGATINVVRAQPVVAGTRSVMLRPRQVRGGDYSPAYDRDDEPSPDAEDWRAPFSRDAGAYSRSALTPAAVVRVGRVGSVRGVEMALLEVAAAQYLPAAQQLTVFASVDVELAFQGGARGFMPARSANPFEPAGSTWIGAGVNRQSVAAPPFDPWDVSYLAIGEELLILTAPAYRSAADRLAAHKNDHGLLSRVVTVNDGGGPGPDTKEEIDAFLDQRYASSLVRFSYLLLLGDAEDIEPWMLPRRYKDSDPFPSDFPYAQIDTDPMADDLTPDVAVGRIAVDTLAQADVVVDKIIRYETDPPAATQAHPFYDRASIASFFECCDPAPPAGRENYRRFIQDAEEIRGRLSDRAYTVERIYTTDATEVAPRYYTDGVTLLPPELLPASGFPWDGDTQDVVDAFNEGRSLFFHLDHGGRTGWSHPSFKTTHFGGLENGDYLPVVFSDNCTSGAFDGSTPGFAETLLRKAGGGAIGVLAFTRGSNNGVGIQFLRGAIDALWPGSYLEGNTTVRTRLGDLLNHARAFIAMGEADADPGSTGYLVAWAYCRMLTLFGDPSLAVWRASPKTAFPDVAMAQVVGPELRVEWPIEGTVITALAWTRDGPVPVGRGVVVDGLATLPSILDERAIPDPSVVQGISLYASTAGSLGELTISCIPGWG